MTFYRFFNDFNVDLYIELWVSIPHRKVMGQLLKTGKMSTSIRWHSRNFPQNPTRRPLFEE
jgi:hypothetical protein